MEHYHCTECGLDNVWLAGGYERKTFGAYGTAVSIRDKKALWRSLGRSTVSQDRRMDVQELRFLRTLLDWTQTDLGKRLGCKDGQIVAKWEKAHHMAVPINADTFVRATYREKIGDPAMLTSLNDRLLEMTHRAPGESRRVCEPGSNGTWTLTEEPSEMVLA